MKFELRKGMVDEYIYQRIMGKVSGEGSRQVQEFYYPKDLTLKNKPNPLHEIIMANQEYAVIRKYPSIFGRGGDFLTGINDEGLYFLHDLEIKYGEELEDILKRVNMLESGFQRIQGDILMKTMDINPIIQSVRSQSHSIFKRKLEVKDHLPLSFELPSKDVLGEQDRTHQFNDGSRSNILLHIMTKGKSGYFETWESGKHAGDDMFSSHKLIVEDGYGYANPNRTIFVAIGQKVILKHREHMQVDVSIPSSKVLVFIQQERPNQRLMSD